MQNKEQDGTLQSEESRGQKHDADSGNDGSSNEILQKEKAIDPGNEHHHTNENADRSSRHDAESGGDATGTTGPRAR